MPLTTFTITYVVDTDRPDYQGRIRSEFAALAEQAIRDLKGKPRRGAVWDTVREERPSLPDPRRYVKVQSYRERHKHRSPKPA